VDIPVQKAIQPKAQAQLMSFTTDPCIRQIIGGIEDGAFPPQKAGSTFML